jgi:hypothetical protein
MQQWIVYLLVAACALHSLRRLLPVAAKRALAAVLQRNGLMAAKPDAPAKPGGGACGAGCGGCGGGDAGRAAQTVKTVHWLAPAKPPRILPKS